jgi:hypothetical protein
MKLSLIPLLLISSIGLNKAPIKYNSLENMKAPIIETKEDNKSSSWTSTVDKDLEKQNTLYLK